MLANVYHNLLSNIRHTTVVEIFTASSRNMSCFSRRWKTVENDQVDIFFLQKFNTITNDLNQVFSFNHRKPRGESLPTVEDRGVT